MHTVSATSLVYGTKNTHLRDSCLSRTCFIIVLARVPIHWSSKLQTEIALSSTEAEYTALSQCCRALLLIHRTMKDILSCGLFPNSLKVNNLSTNNITTRKFEHHYHSNNGSKLEQSIIWEDNQVCIHLANDPLQNRPRTNTSPSNGIIFEMKHKRQHKDNKDPHLIKHFWHTEKKHWLHRNSSAYKLVMVQFTKGSIHYPGLGFFIAALHG
jgi:hypothetical protein